MDAWSRAAPVAAIVVLTGFMTGCTLAVRPAISYQVTAQLQIRPDGTAGACYVYALPYPPVECGAVPLTNVDRSTLPIQQSLQDGSIWTSPMQVTGVWTGSALAVTSTRPGGNVTDPPQAHASCPSVADPPPPSFLANQQRLNADASQLADRGVWMIENGWDGCDLEVVLAVADADMIAYLKSNYHAGWVGGWFQPVG